MSSRITKPTSWSWVTRHAAAIIIVLFGFLHLIGITHPPLDEHFWRQADTAAVARNFQYEDANIFLPRVDGREQFSGITGMEFPVYNYAIFLANVAFGFHDWTGRIITVLISLLGLAYMYGLARDRYGHRTGLVTLGLIATSSLWFYFARNIQPDVLMVTLAIGTLYYGNRFQNKGRPSDLIAAFAMLSAAALVKIPAALAALPLIYLVYPRANRAKLAVYSVVAALPVIGWYVWSAYLSGHYGLGQYFYGELSIHDTLAQLVTWHFWARLFVASLALKVTSLVGAAGLLIGGYQLRRGRDLLPWLWLAAGVIFLIAFANKSFVHNYYSLVIVPPVALIAAIGLVFITRQLPRRIAPLFWIVMMIIAGAQVWWRDAPLYHLSNPELTSLAAPAAAIIPVGDRVIAYGGPSPIVLYFADRKGWMYADGELTPQYIASRVRLGAKYLIVPSQAPALPYVVRYRGPAGVIYQLSTSNTKSSQS